MSHWTRVAYAFAFMLVAGIVTLIGLAFLSTEAAFTFLYDYYWVGFFLVAYLFAPMVNRWLKFAPKDEA